MEHSYDALSIQNLLLEQPSVDLSYSDYNLESLSAIPNGYASNVEFDLLPLTSKFCDFSRAYLSLPLTHAPVGGVFSLVPVMGYKGSILSLFRGLEIQTGAGVSLISETDRQHFVSHLDLMLTKNQDWFVTNGADLLYGKDRAQADVISQLTTAGNIANPRTSKYTANPTAIANSQSGLYNVGFKERQRALMEHAIQADNSYVADQSAGMSYVAHIPLRYIHSFFDALDFPIINTRFRWTFHLNIAGSGSNYKPMCLGTKEDGNFQTATSVSTVITPNGTPRIYYHAVKFSAKQNEAISKQLASGFQKKLKYTLYDYNYQHTNVASTANFQFQISPNVSNPKKVFVMCFPTGVVNGETWVSPTTTGAYGLTNIQLMVNGTNYFTGTSFSTLPEQWLALKEAMNVGVEADAVGNISYLDFVKTNRILALDLSRFKERVVDPFLPVSLQITASPQSATAIDIVYLVEREKEITLTFGRSEASVSGY